MAEQMAEEADLDDAAWARIVAHLGNRRFVLHVPSDPRRDPWLQQKRQRHG
jgi:hypothetical protein